VCISVRDVACMARVSLPPRRSFLASRHITWTTLRRLELERPTGCMAPSLKSQQWRRRSRPAGAAVDRSHPTTEKPNPQEPKTYLLVNHARLESGIAMQEIKQVKKQSIYDCSTDGSSTMGLMNSIVHIVVSELKTINRSSIRDLFDVTMHE
jgi:hypothetical protein